MREREKLHKPLLLSRSLNAERESSSIFQSHVEAPVLAVKKLLLTCKTAAKLATKAIMQGATRGWLLFCAQPFC
jgi:hypothetical protein